MGQIKEVLACFGLDHLVMADDGRIFDAGAAIISALELAEIINLVGVAESEDRLQAAYRGMALCLGEATSRTDAISGFESLLRKRGQSVAFMSEIFRLVVEGKPYATPQSIKDEGNGHPQSTPAPSPVAKSLKSPSNQPRDPIDDLFAGLSEKPASKKGAVPARTPGSSSPASSPDGGDAIDRLFNPIASPPALHRSNGGDEPDAIDRLFDSLGP